MGHRFGDNQERRHNNVTFEFWTAHVGTNNVRVMTTSAQISLEKVRILVIETLPQSADNSPSEMIFGPGGALDSLGLVGYLADLEYRIAEVFGREVVLASEAAMSRSRSPFRDVTALSEYIFELLGA